MGFCLFNNIAVAARVAIDEHGLDRVLIVDWDVHHGNGTQDMFYADGRVGFLLDPSLAVLSRHGRGGRNRHRSGLGCDAESADRIWHAAEDYIREQFRSELEKFAAQIRPQLVLVSAGFDSHREDPIGSLGLEVEDFGELTQIVLDVANVHAGGRVVSLLEGGYKPARLAECVAEHLASFALKRSSL